MGLVDEEATAAETIAAATEALEEMTVEEKTSETDEG